MATCTVPAAITTERRRARGLTPLGIRSAPQRIHPFLPES